jgi:hypothetical protein
MTSRDFAYWLQGVFELMPADKNDELLPWQVKKIKNHLNMVFAHDIDPSMGDSAHQGKLSALHEGLPILTEESSSQTASPFKLTVDQPGGYKLRC